MPIVDSPDSRVDAEMSRALKERFLCSQGLVLDSELDNHPHMIIAVQHLLNWFSNLEELAQQPLGRRLAHASADHETWRQMRRQPGVPKGLFSRRKRIPWLQADWTIRGIGKLSELDGERLQVDDQVQSAIAGGQAAGAWEVLQGSRFRFRWEQQDSLRTNIVVERDNRPAQPPRSTHSSWSKVPGQGEPRFASVEMNKSGWEVDGLRSFLLGRDLLLRLETEMIPHITVKFDDGLYQFEELDEDMSRMWNLMARSEQKTFYEQGEHIMVAELEHWRGIIKRFFSMMGLGEMESISELDSHGGIEIQFQNLFHPALMCGRLMGCWQRAYGRHPRCKWKLVNGIHIVELRSRHELA